MQIKAGDHHSDHDAIVSTFNLVFFAETHHGNHAGCRVHTRPPFQNYVELECTQSFPSSFQSKNVHSIISIKFPVQKCYLARYAFYQFLQIEIFVMRITITLS